MADRIVNNINEVRAHIPAHVELVCVSKFQPIDAIRKAYDAGERHFGESRVQELKKKNALLPADIHWHFIGHLQSNKVRDLLKLRPFLIHSVDSERLLQTIDSEAAKLGFVQDVLLEVHVAREETKTGLTPGDLSELLSRLSLYPHTRVLGLMTMATNTDDETEIRRCFTEAYKLLGDLPVFSAGMSDDYPVAIECGANMVRIGSTIFGERYNVHPKAVFFDQDGVLYDSMPMHAEAWEEVMTRHHLNFNAKDVYINEGRTGQDVIHEAITTIEHREPAEEEIWAIYHEKNEAFTQHCPNGAPVMNGVHEVLNRLTEKGTQCWVVTGSGQKTLLERLLTVFPGIFTSQRIITAYDVAHGKPDPEPYLKAWERSGFAKSECYVVENAPLGVRAAKAAGLFTIAVNTGPLPDELLAAEGADIIFHSMSELLQWIQ